MLKKIGNHIRARRIKLGITQQELAEKVGYTSNSTINKIENGAIDIPQSKLIDIADALQTTPVTLLGYKVPHNSYPVDMTSHLRPVYESIVAGVPIEAQSDIIDRVAINSPNPEQYFGIKVNGDSMVDAGIPDGCTAIFRAQQNADSGQIVAACINGETTLKRYTVVGDTVILMPANQYFEPIVITQDDDFSIYGVLVQIRKDFV